MSQQNQAEVPVENDWLKQCFPTWLPQPKEGVHCGGYTADTTVWQLEGVTKLTLQTVV